MPAVTWTIFFLALAGVPETANQVTIAVPVSLSDGAPYREYMLERSADGWYEFAVPGNPAALLLNRRGDQLLFSERHDFPRVAAYLAALDETKCDTCGKLPTKSLRVRPKPCDVHGEIPGGWLDIAQAAVKPKSGWQRTGELRFRYNGDVRMEIKTAEDGNGLDFNISYVDVSPDGSLQQKIWSSRVRWSRVDEADE